MLAVLNPAASGGVIAAPNSAIVTGVLQGTDSYYGPQVLVCFDREQPDGSFADEWCAGPFEYGITFNSWNYFEAHGLPAGRYIVQFYDYDPSTNIEYWDDQPTPLEADVIELSDGQTLDLGTIILDDRHVETRRVTGSDRFSTSVEISQTIFPSVPPAGVPVVYLANGLNYPDALAAGPAAIKKGGVVLLSYPWALPSVVGAELSRLNPQRIVVVGGPPSIDDAVLETLRTYVDTPSQVVRLTGSDRFGTSREIARDAFLADGADIAFIATGLNYPDALAAGPAAGVNDAPIILVNGTLSHLDDLTVELLAHLGVQRVYIIGGAPSVSQQIEFDLWELLGSSEVFRITGADRWGTATQIRHTFFLNSHTGYLATGLNFPDALAGGPAAAAVGGPMYLSPQSCVPSATLADLNDSRINVAVLLGGTPSLSSGVEQLTSC
jgi:putative cell wall-binding protein